MRRAARLRRLRQHRAWLVETAVIVTVVTLLCVWFIALGVLAYAVVLW